MIDKISGTLRFLIELRGFASIGIMEAQQILFYQSNGSDIHLLAEADNSD
jgi:hypothetical protein